MQTSTGPVSPTFNTRQLILLGAVAALGSLAIQIIVPTLPALTAGIESTARDGQLVISMYLATLAVGQLICAPLADRFGRRPLLLGGTAAFLLGTVCCAIASDLAQMLAGRVVQAAGAAAALVAARTMAIDSAPEGKTASQLAILMSVILISPALAPAVGGAIAGLGGWRLLFWTIAALTIAAQFRAAAIGRGFDHAQLQRPPLDRSGDLAAQIPVAPCNLIARLGQRQLAQAAPAFIDAGHVRHRRRRRQLSAIAAKAGLRRILGANCANAGEAETRRPMASALASNSIGRIFLLPYLTTAQRFARVVIS